MPTTYFLLRWSPGPTFPPGLTFRNAPLDDHIAYIKTALADGNVKYAGPFVDGSGGMTVIQAPSLADARAFAENDPAFVRGAIVVEIKEWKVLFGG